MKVAFLHYHLKTGGVTTVLKQQITAVGHHSETLVLTGSLPDEPLNVDIRHIPDLGYSHESQNPCDPVEVARLVMKAILQKFNGPCDVLHIHNPTLAKNRQFLDIITLLQNEGVNLLLQIHDFAEDGRPQAYFKQAYPADCHYGVINKRDYQILLKAGLKRNGLHLLENTVTAPDMTRKAELSKSMVLYPIRAIRRKNIGEAILLSLFIGDGKAVVITLPPNSPDDIASYRHWQAFVRDQGLNIQFDQGLKQDFRTLVLAADSLISTSITEGFGFSFLEPWLSGKLLWGRKLADICRGFEGKGVSLEHLYTTLKVPVDWIDLGRFWDRWSDCVRKACKLYHFSLGSDRLGRAFEVITADGTIDFGLLDETFQKTIILRLIASARNTAKLVQLNPFLAEPGLVADPGGLIAANRQAILHQFDPVIYREKLMNIYAKVSTTPIRQKIDKTVLVSSFLNLEQFSLLKWCDYRR